MSAPDFTPYAVDGIGLVIDHDDGGSYIVQLLDGRVCGFPAPAGDPQQANAAADIAAAIASPPQPPAPVDDRPIGTRVALSGSFLHSQISTSAGSTRLGVIPAGWAPVDFQANVTTGLGAGKTMAVGTAGSPTRWVSAMDVSIAALKQATPAQLFPQSVSGDTPVFLKKSGFTTTGEIINACMIIERKY